MDHFFGFIEFLKRARGDEGSPQKNKRGDLNRSRAARPNSRTTPELFGETDLDPSPKKKREALADELADGVREAFFAAPANLVCLADRAKSTG